MISFGGIACAKGLWTPTVRGSSTAGTQSYSAQVGYWRIIDTTFEAWFRLALTAVDGSIAGNVQIGGLPFAPLTDAAMFWPGALSSVGLVTHSTFTQFGIRVASAAVVIDLLEFGLDSAAPAAAAVPTTALAATSSFNGSISYRIA